MLPGTQLPAQTAAPAPAGIRVMFGALPPPVGGAVVLSDVDRLQFGGW